MFVKSQKHEYQRRKVILGCYICLIFTFRYILIDLFKRDTSKCFWGLEISTSSFARKGKVRPPSLMMENEAMVAHFAGLGAGTEVKDDTKAG